jgi:23S rRNA (guanosine2251-2'-O)-methyltransferase
MQSTKENFIYGFRAILETIKTGKPVDKILLRKGLSNELFNELFQVIRETGIPYQFVPQQKLDRITKKNHQGAIAFISPVEFHNLEEVLPLLFEQGKNPFLLILDRITDVRNFGAIARSAECAGVHAILIPHKNTASINEDAVKTSAGALSRIRVCRTSSLEQTAKYLKSSGIQLVAASEKASKEHFQVDFTLPTAVIMGSEDKGISNKLLEVADNLAKIPLMGDIDSLNVSVATGVFLFEVVRQRHS